MVGGSAQLEELHERDTTVGRLRPQLWRIERQWERRKKHIESKGRVNGDSRGRKKGGMKSKEAVERETAAQQLRVDGLYIT